MPARALRRVITTVWRHHPSYPDLDSANRRSTLATRIQYKIRDEESRRKPIAPLSAACIRAEPIGANNSYGLQVLINFDVGR
jgi:hypothetical protein